MPIIDAIFHMPQPEGGGNRCVRRSEIEEVRRGPDGWSVLRVKGEDILVKADYEKTLWAVGARDDWTAPY